MAYIPVTEARRICASCGQHRRALTQALNKAERRRARGLNVDTQEIQRLSTLVKSCTHERGAA